MKQTSLSLSKNWVAPVWPVACARQDQWLQFSPHTLGTLQLAFFSTPITLKLVSKSDIYGQRWLQRLKQTFGGGWKTKGPSLLTVMKECITACFGRGLCMDRGGSSDDTSDSSFHLPPLPTPSLRPSSVAMLAMRHCRMSAGFNMNSCKSTSSSTPSSSSSLTTLGSNMTSYITSSSPNVFLLKHKHCFIHFTLSLIINCSFTIRQKGRSSHPIVMPLYYKSFIFEYLSQNSFF